MIKINKMKIKGAEAVIKSLLEEGADTLFGYIGGTIMPVYDALYDYGDKLEHVLTRHEQGAIHAAQAYARVSGKPGICFATSGPGSTNLVTGLADAYLDSTPIVCITGQVGSTLLGTDAFQEQDIISISIPVTKWNFQVTKPEEIPSALAKAFYVAKTGRPGPVLVDITKDAQMAELDFHYEKCLALRSYFPYPKVDSNSIAQAAKLINESKKPLILAGHGVELSKGEKALIELAEKAQIPVASTLHGLSTINHGNELYVGMLGMHGNYGPNIKTNECDLLIAIGMRFDDRVTGDLNRYAKQAKVIHIEIDKSEINKNVYANVPIVSDAKQALTALIPLVNAVERKAWLNEFKECDIVEYNSVIKKQLKPDVKEIHMGEVINIISEKTEGQAIMVTDVGQHQMITARYYKFKQNGSFVTSGGLGTMGFGLPAAFGAKMAAPQREVIAVVGDGGFQMTIQELGTYMQYKIPIKVLVLNNNFLGMVRQWQEMFFNRRYSYTEMQNPDFVKITEAYGIKAKKVSERKNLTKAINEMLESKETYLLEVEVAKEQNVLPMVPAGESVSNIRLK